MGIHIDLNTARIRMDEAMQLADSTESLPLEWIQRAQQIVASPSRTYVVALATALLARATDERTNALILKETYDDPGAYSARTLCHQVLVPMAREHNIDLRVTGREPLNNQPFFRYDRIDQMNRVHSRAQRSYEFLVECVKAANTLRWDEALRALAAFLRTCGRRQSLVSDLSGVAEPLTTLGNTAAAFLSEAVEEGKRAQAIVAAVLDLAFEDVRTSRVNDPSRHWPGDCHVIADDSVIMAIEVRAKPVLPGEVIEFAGQLAKANIGRGIVVALSPKQEPFDTAALADTARHIYGILLQVVTDIRELLVDALMWSPRPINEVLARFPDHAMQRLIQLEVQEETLQRWASLYKPPASLHRAADNT